MKKEFIDAVSQEDKSKKFSEARWIQGFFVQIYNCTVMPKDEGNSGLLDLFLSFAFSFIFTNVFNKKDNT